MSSLIKQVSLLRIQQIPHMARHPFTDVLVIPLPRAASCAELKAILNDAPIFVASLYMKAGGEVRCQSWSIEVSIYSGQQQLSRVSV